MHSWKQIWQFGRKFSYCSIGFFMQNDATVLMHVRKCSCALFICQMVYFWLDECIFGKYYFTFFKIIYLHRQNFWHSLFLFVIVGFRKILNIPTALFPLFLSKYFSNFGNCRKNFFLTKSSQTLIIKFWTFAFSSHIAIISHVIKLFHLAIKF